MNKITFILLFFCCTTVAFSQSLTIAKLKYEEAEEAFENKAFNLSISKLDEAEKILGVSNPKILYLRIIVINKQIEESVFSYFGRLQNLRENCSFYLKNYENIANIEDKYREVYKISEALKQYPTTKEAFDIWAKPQKQLYCAQNIKDVITINNYELKYKLNKPIDPTLKVEVIPQDYCCIKINDKKLELLEMFPMFSGITVEQFQNRSKLKVNEDGSIWYNGALLIAFYKKEYALKFQTNLDELSTLAW